MSRSSKRLCALLIAAAIPACAGQSTPPPGTSIQLEKLPRVANSAASPCWQQVEIAAQNAYIATVQSNKEVVYKAPCELDATKKKAARTK